MVSLATAFVSSFVAAFWSIRELRRTCVVFRFDPAIVAGAMRSMSNSAGERLAQVVMAEGNEFEARLVRAVWDASSMEQARTGINEELLEGEWVLSRGSKVFGVCARIAGLGALLSVALLIGGGVALGWELLGIVAVGGSGILVSLAAGAECKQVVDSSRSAVDGLVDAVLAVRFSERGAR